MCVSVPYKITLLSNLKKKLRAESIVSVPYKITLLSNRQCRKSRQESVSVPYKITLLSNYAIVSVPGTEFQYLIKLHYSQTKDVKVKAYIEFQYLIKLHYSQTAYTSATTLNSFSTL